MVELINNWNVVRMLAKPPYPFGRADAESFLKSVQRRQGTADDVAYALTIDTEFVGVISVTPHARAAELGFWLGEPYWGRGLMSEAVGSVVAEFFRQPGSTALLSGVFRDNDASLTVQQKFGFEVIGESLVMCRARGEKVQHIDTKLTRQRFEELQS